MKIGIIGGGITGVSLAYKLSKLGQSVTLYERSARMGGLVGSFRIGNVWLEKYFHHIFLSDTSIRKLIAEVGLEHDLLWKITHMGFYGSGTIYPFDSPADLLTFSHLSLIDRVRLGYNIWKSGKMKGGLSLDSLTAKEWVEESWGGKIYEKFWGPLLKAKFSQAGESISAAWLWGRIYARANSRTGTREKLGYLRGGFVRLMEEMGKRVIQAGNDLRLHQEVKKVERISNHKWRVHTDKDQSEYDRVVLAIPSPRILEICELPAEEKEVHSNVSYVAILCMPILMNQPLSEIYWLNVGDESVPFTGVIEQTNFIPKSDYDNVHIAYLFNYLPQNHPWLLEPKTQVFARYETGLKKVFPNYRRSQIQQVMIFKDPYANPIYEKNYLNRMPPIASKVPGLFYANTAQIFPDDRNQNYSIELADRVIHAMGL